MLASRAMADAAPALIEFPLAETPVEPTPRPWPLTARLAFRFFSVYFTLYVICTQMLNGFIPFPINLPNLSDQGPVRWTRPADPKWGARFTYDQPSPDRLTMSGEMDGKRIVMKLELFPRERFLLVSRGFNWVQEYPFNR